MSEHVLLWLIGASVTIVVWAVRVEAKVQAHDRDLAQMRSDASQFRADMRTDNHQMREDLQYIRTRIDEVAARR